MEAEASLNESVAYYRRHAPERVRGKAGLRTWQPIIEEMIDGDLNIKEMTTWMTAHHETLGFKLPSTETLKKWVSDVRKEIGKPLRVRKPRSSSVVAKTASKAAAAPTRPGKKSSQTALEPESDPVVGTSRESKIPEATAKKSAARVESESQGYAGIDEILKDGVKSTAPSKKTIKVNRPR